MVESSAISAISGGAAAATSKINSDESKFAKDFDDFLKLLITQLQNQDPTAPLDTNQFTEQIVQFSSVEQSINTNKKLDELITATRSGQASDIVSFTGKEVEAEGHNVTLKEGEDTVFAYNLEKKAKNAFVTIKDSGGTTIFSGTATSNAGRNLVSWDGITNSGNKAEPGVYQVFVTSESDTGAFNEETTIVKGTVMGVNLDTETPTLIVNGEEISLDKVRFIGEEDEINKDSNNG